MKYILKYIDPTFRDKDFFMTRKINNKKRVIKKFHQQRQIICTRLWMLDHSMEERITTPLPPQVSSFQSERPVWIVSGKEMVENRLSITSIPSLSLCPSTWRFLPWLCGLCRGNPDPFSSGINVTGRCS